MRQLSGLLAIPFAIATFAATAQSITPSPSNTIYDFFISGPVTASLNGGATVTGNGSLGGSGYGASTAGTGPGWQVYTVPLTSLVFTGPSGITGNYAAPGVFYQQNVNPATYPMYGGASMSIGGITLSGNFNLNNVFGYTRNEGQVCSDCSSTFTTTGGNVITFQFASGPVITALEVAAATGVAPVPEPATLLLIGGGLGAFALKRRRRGAMDG